MLKSDHIQAKDNYLYLIALIGFTFIGTGTAFMVQLYRLLDHFDGNTVSLLTGGLYYVFQAASIGIVALLFRKHPTIAGGRWLPFIAIIAIIACAMVSVFSYSAAIINIAGMLMNLMIGVLSGCYLTRLVTDVPQQQRGIVFGGAYAIGSVGTWLLSLPMNGKFLHSDASIVSVSALMLVSLPLLWLLKPPIKQVNEGQARRENLDKNIIWLAAALLFLLSLVNTLGFSFPLQSAYGSVYIEFTRAFYAGGLISAGLISDKNRRWGAICCVAALAFPFAALALGSSVAGETIMWIFAYLFLGFFTVYRILVFSDISAKTGLLPLAVLGLFAGRLGDASGAFGANLLTGTPLIVFSGVLFVLIVVLFFSLYQKLYTPAANSEELERRRFEAYAARFGLSAREQEIFRLIIQGMSNAEIANALYIAESTVKFHAGNIFKKTGRANRSELTADFQLGEH